MTDPILNQEDLRSATWRKIKAHLEDELIILRKHLEADQTIEKTQRLRGQIRSHISTLALEALPAPALVEEEDD